MNRGTVDRGFTVLGTVLTLGVTLNSSRLYQQLQQSHSILTHYQALLIVDIIINEVLMISVIHTVFHFTSVISLLEVSCL